MLLPLKKATFVVALVLALSGCATPVGPATDPLEPMNRAVFAFNEKADEYVLAPVARGYRNILPQVVRTGITNFFSNLDDLWIGVNNVLQGKINDAAIDLARFTWNSTLGVLGLVDVASGWELPKHNEDLGQTLGRWGLGTGPYLVLPLFGPSNVRDGIGLYADSFGDIVRNLDDVPTRNTLYATRAVNTRANLLDATQVLEQAALDKYRFVRDAYLQRRRNLVYDGNPPRERLEDDEPEAPAPAAPSR